MDLVGTDGTKFHWTFSAKVDGKDYPATGSSPFGDTLAITRVNPNTVRIVSKLAGKQTIEQTIVVAPDGKTRTTTAKGTDAKGQPVDTMSFYEKRLKCFRGHGAASMAKRATERAARLCAASASARVSP